MRNALTSTGLLLLIVLILLAIPYGVAFVTGTPQPELTGMEALHEQAASSFCAEGYSPIAGAFIGVTALAAIGFIAVSLRPQLLGGFGKTLRSQGALIVVLLVLTSLPFLIAWNTGTSACERGEAYFWQSILIDIFILSILAISYNLLFGFAGIVSFGHAAFFGVGAYLVGILTKLPEWPIGVAILIALFAGAGIALIKGLVGLRIRGLYFALFTLAFAEVLFLLGGNRLLVAITGAEDGFTFEVPDILNTTRNRLMLYYLVLVFLAGAYSLVRQLMDSPTGRALLAVRDNESRAQMIGFNPLHYKLIALLIAGLMATGAGILRGIIAKGASPNVLGIGFTFDPLLATIIGGAGTFSGPVIGVFLTHLMEHFLRDTTIMLGTTEINVGNYWAIILGVTFIVIVLIFPRGIIGSLQTWWARWKARRRT